jgi:hypothetical protein
MKQRIFGHTPWNKTDLREILTSELSYKIVVARKMYVEMDSNLFELGDCEYGVAVDSFLEHQLVGNVGASEMTTVSRNADFLKIFDSCCGYMVYRDQVDPSSIVRKRPDDTIVYQGCVCLKNEAKGDQIEAQDARKELTDKLNPEALKVFPSNSQSIFGMTSFPNMINLYSIVFDPTSNKFSTNLITSFDLRHLYERVRFIKAVFKIAEWISVVSGPHEDFHLIPGVRRKTTNGHHITWSQDCLLKELKLHATDHSERTATMKCIGEIYAARLTNVEWGTVGEPNFLHVTRVGFMLRKAILGGMISREKAVADVRAGK